jgi:hypothetical protein
MRKLGNAVGRGDLGVPDQPGELEAGRPSWRWTRALWPGALIVLLGAWGAGIAYFGPSVGLGPANWPAWRWSLPHTVLNLVPGVATVIAGAAVAWGRASGRRAVVRLGGVLAALSAAWFVLGAAVYPVVLGSPAPSAQPGRGALANLETLAAYGRGVGIAVGILAGIALAAEALRARSAPAAAVVPLGTSEAQATSSPGPSWRPQFRSTISRMVPRPAGPEKPVGEAATGPGRVGVLPGATAPASIATGGGEPKWRPRFMAGAAAGRPSAGAASPVARSALRPGEWLLATFPRARLQADDPATARQGTAVVTNRRVVFAGEGGRDVRDWDLEAVPAEPGGSETVELADHVVIDLRDSATGHDFTAAVQAATTALARGR